MNRARPAQPETAAELGPGHAQHVAQHPEHGGIVVDVDALGLPVDSDGECHGVLSFSASDARTRIGSDPKDENESIERWCRSILWNRWNSNRPNRWQADAAVAVIDGGEGVATIQSCAGFRIVLLPSSRSM